MLSSTSQPAEKPDPASAQEMPRMMLALDIEPGLAEADLPALYAGLQSVCAGCGSKDQCRGDLAAETAAATFQTYCGNAATLTKLMGRPELARD